MRPWLTSLALLLAGCDDMPRARTESEIRDIARQMADEQTQALQARIGKLEERADKANADIQGVRLLGLEVAGNLDGLRNTFNGNVQRENEYLAKQMTARGGCGTEVVTYPGGGTAWRNKECTVKDLR